MKHLIFGILKRLGLYYFVKYYPPLFKLRLKILNPSLAKSIDAENELFNNVLPPGVLNMVIDGGANVGHLTSYFEKKFNKVIAVEPVPGNAAELRARFNGKKKIVIVEKIIDSEEGKKELLISADKDHTVSTVNKQWSEWWEKENKSQKIRYNDSIEVSTVTLPQLIKIYGLPDFLKLDIEGNEWQAISLLTDCIPLISFETHLPGFMDDTLKILQHLGGLTNNLRVNASVDDSTLQFPEFIGSSEFIQWLTRLQPGYAQVFCKLK